MLTTGSSGTWAASFSRTPPTGGRRGIPSLHHEPRKRAFDSHSEKDGIRPAGSSGKELLLRLLHGLVRHDGAGLHDPHNLVDHHADVLERIAIHGDQVRVEAG